MKKSLIRNVFCALALSVLAFGTANWMAGCSDNSVKSEAVVPSTPTNLTVTQVDSTTAVLAWTASSDNVVVAGYNVYRGDSIAIPPVLIGTTPINSFRDTTLVTGSTYTWTVQAYDCFQNLSAYSDPADTSTIGPIPSDTTILRAAFPFGIFSAVGITNTGASTVNGDIGMTPGTSYVGFPPGTLNGTLHINDSVATAAKAAWQAAYTDLAGRPCDVVSPSLNGTLTPQIYCFPSSAGLATLILDGPGLYVFQIGSTLTSSTGASVTLINGATADKVFWVVGSSATLGTNTVFQGTIIAQASVTLNTGASITNGRAAVLAGAITLDNNIVTVP